MAQPPSRTSASKAAAGKSNGTRAAGSRPTTKAAGAGTTSASAAKTTGAKTTGAKTTGAKTTGAKTTGAKTTGAKTTAAKTSRASASPKTPASGSTARSTSRSTARGTSRTATARTATPRSTTARRAAAQNGAASKLPAGVPEAARRTVVLPRSTATGLEASRQRMTPAERRVRGKAARAEVPRESHAEWKPPADRADPVALLQSQAATRLPDLVPVRYGRMMETPFTYYRGAALPMASDLATTPATGMIVQACGDAHLSNFGLFGSPERKLVFDVNDFDETLPAPWEWDVKRLAASLEVAARENGFSDKDRRKIALAAVARYRQVMQQLAGLTNLDVWYTQVDIQEFRARFDGMLKERQRRTLDKGLAKARTRDSMQELQKLTRIEDGQPRIIPDPPVIIPIRDLLGELPEGADIATELRGLVAKYRRTLQPDRRVLLEQYEVADLARKVVGVGSVGTRCWIALLLGRDDSDPLFLQIKEAEESVLARFAGPSKYSNQGERVVNGQQLMQAASDIFLGWQRFTGLDGTARDFYVRQLRDWKFSVDIAAMVPRGLRLYGELCGLTLARAHARSGDEIAMAAYMGGSAAFESAIADFAGAYADQNEHDFHAFTEAIASGRLLAERGV
jgi:uncharacterized protein (DUF2252 family)